MNKGPHHRGTERFRNGKEAFDQRDHGLHAGGQDLPRSGLEKVGQGHTFMIWRTEVRGHISFCGELQPRKCYRMRFQNRGFTP